MGAGAEAVAGVAEAGLVAEAGSAVLAEAVLEEAAPAAVGSRNTQNLCKQKNKLRNL